VSKKHCKFLNKQGYCVQYGQYLCDYKEEDFCEKYQSKEPADGKD